MPAGAKESRTAVAGGAAGGEESPLGSLCLLVGQHVGLPRHSRPPREPIEGAGGFPLISMGFGSSPWHAACLFWTPSEDENILSVASLSPSPVDQLLLAPRSHRVTPLWENAVSCSACLLLHSQTPRTQAHLQDLIWSNNKSSQPASFQIQDGYCPFICPELPNEHCTGTLVIK